MRGFKFSFSMGKNGEGCLLCKDAVCCSIPRKAIIGHQYGTGVFFHFVKKHPKGCVAELVSNAETIIIRSFSVLRNLVKQETGLLLGQQVNFPESRGPQKPDFYSTMQGVSTKCTDC